MSLMSGFVPRVTSRNRRGVARALHPTLDEPDGLQVPWMILDAPSALADPTVPAHLSSAGTRTLIDTGAWRFADRRTFDTPKWANLPYTPNRPFEPTAAWINNYIARDLCVQAELGASIYLVPGWFPPPRTPSGEVVQRADLIFQAADRVVGRDIDAKPLVAYVPVRSGDLENGHTYLSQLHNGYEGVYVQISPAKPYSDPVHRLSRQVALLTAAQAEGRHVIAGHLGALATTLRALGIAAADAGLGEAESFDLSSKIKNQQPRSPKEKAGRPPAPRVYVPEIGRSIDGRLWLNLMSVPAIRAELLCRRPCCRFRSWDTLPQRVTEHALCCRIKESQAIESRPASMRIDYADRLLSEIETRLGVINSALAADEQRPLPLTFIHAQRALLAEYYPHLGAA
jgi:hypothetical protein